jgi:hypothetical protein
VKATQNLTVRKRTTHRNLHSTTKIKQRRKVKRTILKRANHNSLSTIRTKANPTIHSLQEKDTVRITLLLPNLLITAMEITSTKLTTVITTPMPQSTVRTSTKRSETVTVHLNMSSTVL